MDWKVAIGKKKKKEEKKNLTNKQKNPSSLVRRNVLNVQTTLTGGGWKLCLHTDTDSVTIEQWPLEALQDIFCILILRHNLGVTNQNRRSVRLHKQSSTNCLAWKCNWGGAYRFSCGSLLMGLLGLLHRCVRVHHRRNYHRSACQ